MVHGGSTSSAHYLPHYCKVAYRRALCAHLALRRATQVHRDTIGAVRAHVRTTQGALKQIQVQFFGAPFRSDMSRGSTIVAFQRTTCATEALLTTVHLMSHVVRYICRP